ncbi:restriction endonuclease subunit S [Serratia nevei]|uniref:restriction endonuclease subunit S n=1 Tax=Serratia nevei TaxID=2703794 RepID=UPI0011CCABBC|nr:restriction endonuclease subunit S [Serratia nevei]TXE73208.1 restriction endonuclease subunit S [Serratia nevei]
MSVEKLITDHIDIWSSALQTRSTAGRGSNGKIDLYGIKKLRELILELAVRGKLVPQDPNDEPASELLKRIAAEKAELVKQGKIKKQKPLPEISEDEKPFELPKGWAWIRLGDATINRDSERIPLSSDERSNRQGIYDYYGASGVIDNIDDFLFDETLLLIGEDGANLINRTTSIAFMAHGKYWVNNHAHVLDGICVSFLEYVCLYINSINLEQYITGTAQPKMNQAKMNTILLGLAPKREQSRILSKVNILMSLCDQLEQHSLTTLDAHQQLVETLLATLTDSQNAEVLVENWARISQHFDTLFTTEASIDALKQTILQLAVMGKLVPQDPNDEPASELLKRIGQEKAQLVKEGKIKKQKPLPLINDDEKPFELPEGWTWVTLSHLGIFSGGKTPSKMRDEYWGGDIPWVTPKDMKTWLVTNSEDFVTSLAIESGLSKFSPGCLLFVARSGILRRTFPVAITAIECTVNQDLKVLKPFVLNTNSYILLMMRGFEKYILENLTKVGTTVESLLFDEFSSHPFMLPPLEEQLRICDKVNEILNVCDTLKYNLHSAQQTQLHLADALTDAALN